MEKEKAYMYTRVSTEMQVEKYSLASQKEMIHKFAEMRGIDIVREYCDEGKTGTNTVARDSYNNMIDDIKSERDKGISYVIVFKLSRFGRNAADILASLQVMEDFGVGLYCVLDGIDSRAGAGKLILTIMSAVVEIEHDNILAQTMEGRQQKAREGKWNGGFAPYGYRLENGELKIEEPEAEIIRLVFQKYTETNLGANGVATWLNKNGYVKHVRQNGTLDQFSAHFIKIVLDNPVYCGKIAYGRRKTEKIKGKRNESHIVRQKEFPVYRGIHEAIVSEEVWNAAHEKRIETGVKREKKEKDHEYILSGLVRCPGCGAPMYGIPSRKKRPDGTPYPVSYSYKCRNNSRASGHDCTWKRQVACAYIDSGVENIVLSLIENGQFTEEVQEQVQSSVDIKALAESRDSQKARLKSLFALQKKLEEKIDSLDYTSDIYEKQYESHNRRLEKCFADIACAEEQLRDTMQKMADIENERLNNEAILTMLSQFREIYPKMTDAEKKSIMQCIIESIELYKEKTNGCWIKEVRFHFPIIYNEESATIFRPNEITDETVVLLGRKNTKATSHLDLIIKTDKKLTGGKATYGEIKKYIKEQFGLSVSSLYISQIKDKCGLEKRENYHIGHGSVKELKCPQQKEEAILTAFKHFCMI